jgi:hypothetical protein
MFIANGIICWQSMAMLSKKKDVLVKPRKEYDWRLRASNTSLWLSKAWK